MAKKATSNALNELHETVARILKEGLDDEDRCTPQLLAQAIKFLKDNNVTADPDYSQTLSELNNSVINLETLPFPVKAVGDEE